MSGEWLYRDVENHKCATPAGHRSITVGDIWKCVCGKMWRVTKNEYTGSQRGDWYYDIAYVEHTGEVPKQNTKLGYAINRPDTVLGGYRDR